MLLVTVASAQVASDANNAARVKEKLQKLFVDLNQAITKKDRPALERVYADEFQFIHGNGYVVNKTSQISGILSNDPISSAPVPAPAFDDLLLYGDVAILRGTARGSKKTDAEMTFTKNDKGEVTDVILKLGMCQESKAKKLE